MAESCKSCLECKPANQKETLVSHDIASQAREKIGCDLFTIEGRDYLIVIDYHTNFIEVEYLHPATSSKVTHAVEKMCARYGVPKVIVSDNGPQFTAREFRKFITEWNIKHMLSSPYHQQSNGKAESAVKIIKNLMRKCIKEGSNTSFYHKKQELYFSLITTLCFHSHYKDKKYAISMQIIKFHNLSCIFHAINQLYNFTE